MSILFKISYYIRTKFILTFLNTKKSGYIIYTCNKFIFYKYFLLACINYAMKIHIKIFLKLLYYQKI